MGNPIHEPTPDELKQRRVAIDWLQQLGFSVTVVDSIVIRDAPPFHRVEQMIRKYGLTAARRRLEEWCDD